MRSYILAVTFGINFNRRQFFGGINTINGGAGATKIESVVRKMRSAIMDSILRWPSLYYICSNMPTNCRNDDATADDTTEISKRTPTIADGWRSLIKFFGKIGKEEKI